MDRLNSDQSKSVKLQFKSDVIAWIFPCSDSRSILALDFQQYLTERYWLISTSTPCLGCKTARKIKWHKTDQILGDLFQSDIPSEFDCPLKYLLLPQLSASEIFLGCTISEISFFFQSQFCSSFRNL